jgi:hypothetical protein
MFSATLSLVENTNGQGNETMNELTFTFDLRNMTATQIALLRLVAEEATNYSVSALREALETIDAAGEANAGDEYYEISQDLDGLL